MAWISRFPGLSEGIGGCGGVVVLRSRLGRGARLGSGESGDFRASRGTSRKISSSWISVESLTESSASLDLGFVGLPAVQESWSGVESLSG